MPTGMLVARPDGASSGPAEMGTLEERLRVSHAKVSGWFGVVSASDGGREERWISADAMALVHDAFARAGFDPFVPRDIRGGALATLSRDLEAFAAEWAQVASVSNAKEHWAERSELVRGLADDGAWLRVREAFAPTLRELVALTRGLASRDGSLRVVAE